jgi:hypothetical protein
MKKISTAGCTAPQLLTRRAVFSLLTGQQQELLFSLLRGDPLKVMEEKPGTPLKSGSVWCKRRNSSQSSIIIFPVYADLYLS